MLHESGEQANRILRAYLPIVLIEGFIAAAVVSLLGAIACLAIPNPARIADEQPHQSE